jgi:Zn-dependent protease
MCDRRLRRTGDGSNSAGSYDQNVGQALNEPEGDLREYRPVHPQSGLRELARRLWAPIAALVGLAVKFKSVFLVLGNAKLFTTAGSMVVSVAAYSWLWGWRFAVGFVALLLVHEVGHVLELRRQGIRATAPMFIPFLGAYVGLKQMPANAWKEAQVALAGPVLGSIGAAAFWLVGEALDSRLLVALAFTGFFLNLFNLLPITPLDGGRAVAAIHPAIWGLGLAGLVALAILHPNPILLLILVVGAFELFARWRQRRTDYYRVTPMQRAAVGVVYLGLAALLAVAMTATHVPRHF